MKLWKLMWLVCIGCAVAACATKKAPEGKTETAPSFRNDADQTDIFAIPLDTSEDEEEQEAKELEALERKPNDNVKKQ